MQTRSIVMSIAAVVLLLLFGLPLLKFLLKMLPILIVVGIIAAIVYAVARNKV